MLSVCDLRTEYLTTPLAVAHPAPRFSWRLEADAPVIQQRYRVSVRAGGDVVWSSGWVVGDAQSQVVYTGEALPAGRRYDWRVDVATTAGDATADSWFETAPGADVFADAAWITIPRPGDNHDDFRPAPHLATRFVADAPVRRARLHITAAGVFEPWLNGQRVGDDRLAPGWTDYAKRVHYQSYDVTDQLRPGENVLGARIAEGWFAGAIGPYGDSKFYGSWPSLHAVLVVESEDGEIVTVPTSTQWRGTFGGTRASSLLQGELHDARLRLGDWTSPEYDHSAWSSVVVGETPAGVLLPAPHGGVREVARLAGRDIHAALPGTRIVDFGQNIAGVATMELTAPVGTQVRLRFAEVLDADGAIYTENLRSARATDTYIAAGTGVETWTPTFTFHGFRYAEITAPVGVLETVTLTASAWSSVEPTAEFDSDVDLLNRLHTNIAWGMRGNFLDVPTDCPQRDERLGWMGDAQVFAPTACEFADVSAFYTKWLADVRDSIGESGKFPDVVPRVVVTNDGSPGYGDAGVMVPWELYRAYGDVRILENMFEPSAAWVRILLEENPDGIWRNARMNDYGDWLAIGEESDKVLIATAYLAQSATLVARMAEVLGRDTAPYRRDADRIRTAFTQEFLRPDGTLISEAQGAHVLALAFDLVPADRRDALADRLVASLEDAGHLRTGFLSVAHLMPLLSSLGRTDLAYRLLLRTEFPSWLYPVTHGATTIWERWDGWTEDGGFQDVNMNSFNHYAFGAVGQWMHEHLAGIRVSDAAPGYRHILVAPEIHDGINRVALRLNTIRGPVASRWERDAHGVRVEVEIPAGSTATVTLSAGTVLGDGAPGDDATGAPIAFEVGSGIHRFRVPNAGQVERDVVAAVLP